MKEESLRPAAEVLAQKKDLLLHQFKNWLDNLPAVPEPVPDADNLDRQIDLYSLFLEFAALKSEVKIESRQFKSAFDQFESTLSLLKVGYDAIKKGSEVPPVDPAELKAAVLHKILPEILIIRDRIADSVAILAQLSPKMIRKKRKYQKKRQWIQKLQEGQAMLLERVDKFLRTQGVTPIAAIGKNFDPHCMQAVAVAQVKNQPNAMVLEEIRKGFLLGDQVLRVAEVKVNKLSDSHAKPEKQE